MTYLAMALLAMQGSILLFVGVKGVQEEEALAAWFCVALAVGDIATCIWIKT